MSGGAESFQVRVKTEYLVPLTLPSRFAALRRMGPSLSPMGRGEVLACGHAPNANGEILACGGKSLPDGVTKSNGDSAKNGKLLQLNRDFADQIVSCFDEITEFGIEHFGDDAGGDHIAASQEQALPNQIIGNPGERQFGSAQGV